MARVFGVLESLVAVSIGFGSILASLMIAWVGLAPALIAIGLVCPVLAVASWWGLRSLDRSVDALDEEVGLLQQVPMFRPLPLPAIEQLARGLEPVTVIAGDAVFRQGDLGDRYYVIESGRADVVGDGRVVAELGPGRASARSRCCAAHAAPPVCWRATSSASGLWIRTGSRRSCSGMRRARVPRRTASTASSSASLRPTPGRAAPASAELA